MNAECLSVERRDRQVAVHVQCVSGDPEVIGSHLLLAVGRRPNTDGLGLEAAGIETDRRGFIMVDEQLRTGVPGIWALGDVNGRGAFTHTSYNDYEMVAANLFDDDPRRISDRIAAYALYIDPPLGRAGLTEQQVRETGRKALKRTLCEFHPWFYPPAPLCSRTGTVPTTNRKPIFHPVLPDHLRRPWLSRRVGAGLHRALLLTIERIGTLARPGVLSQFFEFRTSAFCDSQIPAVHTPYYLAVFA